MIHTADFQVSNMTMMMKWSWDVRNPSSTLAVGFTVFAIAVVIVVIAVSISVSNELEERRHRTIFCCENGQPRTPRPFQIHGQVIAHSATLPDSTQTIFKLTFPVSNSIADEPIDLTPSFTADGRGIDPDPAIVTVPVVVVSYVDKNQAIQAVPWTVRWLENSDGDNLLEADERAEITVWLLNRDNAVSDPESRSSLNYMSSGGMTGDSTVLSENDRFTLILKQHAPRGLPLNIFRSVPRVIREVNNLN